VQRESASGVKKAKLLAVKHNQSPEAMETKSGIVKGFGCREQPMMIRLGHFECAGRCLYILVVNGHELT